VLLTFYGRTLLLKLLVAALAGGLGLLTATRLRRGPDRPAPRRTVLVEGIAVAVVLLLAAVLTSAQPATEPQLTRTAGPSTVRVVDRQAADLQETLAIRPNRPGRNVVLVGVFDTRRPAPAPIGAVTVMVRGPGGVQQSALTAEQLADHQWSVPVDLTAAGTTTVLVSVQRLGLADATSAFDWTVGAAPTRMHPVVLSQAPVRGVLTIGAGALAVLVLFGWLLAGYGRRRRTEGRKPAPEQHVAAPEYADAMAP
jgi:copper transport protein